MTDNVPRLVNGQDDAGADDFALTPEDDTLPTAAVIEGDHQSAQAELRTLRRVVAALSPLSPSAQRRVLRWAIDRYCAGTR